MIEFLLGASIVVNLCFIRHWLYHGRGRWIGVRRPNNVVELRRAR